MSENIRNFCIIAHIDHGKSTLADRFLEIGGAITRNEASASQVLDSMDLERERGITIKAKAVRLNYKSKDGHIYVLNLIDTPGHVDFTYEVAKSLGAVEGAILLVDASQGVEAQSVANYYLARDHNLKIIPVVNKIDLPMADKERVKKQLVDIFGFSESEIIYVSAKEGWGIEDILESIIKQIPPPQGGIDEPLRAFLFDSSYDEFKGVIVYLRVLEGKITKGMEIKLIDKGDFYRVTEIGVFNPRPQEKNSLTAGEVGYICCNIKNPRDVSIPDIVIDKNNPTHKKSFSYRRLPPMVFSGLFPAAVGDYNNLRTAMEKLSLSDPSFVYEPDHLDILGYGFRCGFLGLLHMEIIKERIEREYGIEIILTTPNVRYEVTTKKGTFFVESPYKFPSPQELIEVKEPFVKAVIITPWEFMEPLYELAKKRRGIPRESDYLGQDRMKITFDIPLAEIIVDFYDKVKSVTKGYGSLDYEFIGFRPADIVKVDILFNRKPTGVFSFLVERSKVLERSRLIIEKLKETIPRHMFEINIQAAVGSKIMASVKIPPLRKDVTSKCYGGDITRKRKLWEKQKKGKKKMKMLGQVEVPSRAFLEVLKI